MLSLNKVMIIPVDMYGCESWTMKKAKCQRIDAFELWCWRQLLRVPWTARRCNQSILKELSHISSLEKCLFSSLIHFLIGLFIFLELSCRSCLYIFESNPLSVASFAIIFSHSEGCRFTLHIVSPEYSLEGLMLKLNLQYCGHLMWRPDSLEKILMLGKIEGRRRKGW